MFESISSVLTSILQSGKLSNDVITLIGFVIIVAFIGYGLYYFMLGLKKVFSAPESTVKIENIHEIKEKLDDVNKNIQKTCDSILDNITLNLADIKNIDNNVHIIINMLQQDITQIQSIQENIRIINEQLNIIKNMRGDDAHIIAPIKTNIDNIMQQINSIQRDLSSLHGTIIGIATNRNPLR